VRLWVEELDPNPFLAPVEQQSEEAAGDVLHRRHVDADRVMPFLLDQLSQRLAEQSQVGSVPNFHGAQVDDFGTVPVVKPQSITLGHDRLLVEVRRGKKVGKNIVRKTNSGFFATPAPTANCFSFAS